MNVAVILTVNGTTGLVKDVYVELTKDAQKSHTFFPMRSAHGIAYGRIVERKPGSLSKENYLTTDEIFEYKLSHACHRATQNGHLRLGQLWKNMKQYNQNREHDMSMTACVFGAGWWRDVSQSGLRELAHFAGLVRLVAEEFLNLRGDRDG